MGAFNGTGTFVRTYDWTTDDDNGINIEASRMDTEDDGFATGLSNCITKDGQTIISANIPMNSKKFTGLTNGSARTDSIALGQVQDNTYEYLGENGGVADAYTWTPSPAITAYAAGQTWLVKIGAGDGNTTASTANISAVGSRAIEKSDGAGATTALESGDMIAGSIYKLVDNGTALVLQNPEKPYLNATNITNITPSILDTDAVNNLGIAASVAASALTISLKTKAGTDPSTTDSVKICFRNSTLTTGTYNTRTVTAATSVIVSSGSTLGTISGDTSIVYVYAIDNAGSIELAVSLTEFEDNSIQSTTAEGAAGAADSAAVLYSTTARSNVPIRLIGSITSTQATAGTWATSPAILKLLPKNTESAVLLISQTASASATIDFIDLDTTYSGYNNYEFRFINILPSTTNTAFVSRFSVDNGSNFISANYATIIIKAVIGSSPSSEAGNTSAIPISSEDTGASQGLANTSTNGFNGIINLNKPSSSSVYKSMVSNGCGYVNQAGNYVWVASSGRYTGATTAVNAIRFLFSSGNIASGVIQMWGYK